MEAEVDRCSNLESSSQVMRQLKKHGCFSLSRDKRATLACES